MKQRPWDNPHHDIRADLQAAARVVGEARYEPIEYSCGLGHPLVVCIGDGALIEHVKQAHPDAARELGWLE